jgi:hypothetical protein
LPGHTTGNDCDTQYENKEFVKVHFLKKLPFLKPESISKHHIAIYLTTTFLIMNEELLMYFKNRHSFNLTLLFPFCLIL